MDFLLRCFLLYCFLGSVVRGQASNYVQAVGKTIKIPENECYPAGWYRDAPNKIITIQRGPDQVHISQAGTWTSKKDSQTKKISCKKDSDVTFDAYREVILKTRKTYAIGNVTFIKPDIGPHFLACTSFAVQKGLDTAVSWLKPAAGRVRWTGLDWISAQKPGITRLWWDSVDPVNKPGDELLNRWQCNSNLPNDYKEPTADCSEFLGQPEGKYKMKEKPFSASGTRYHAEAKDPETRYKMDVNMHVNPEKQLFALILGDPEKAADNRSFVIAFWANATGTYLMFSANECIWNPDWKFDNVMDGYSSPQMAWVGKVKLTGWTPDFAEDEEVNLFEGSYNFGEGFAMMSLIDNEGYYRGQVLMDDMTVPPPMFYMDKLKKEAPEPTIFSPYKACKGFQDFLGKKVKPENTSGGDKVNSYCVIVLLLQCSLLGLVF